LPVLPATRRHLVEQIQTRLRQRVAPIVVVRGPRQIGKTTAQPQVLSDLLARGVPHRHDAPEVDFVLTIGTRRIPLEVKYQRRIDPLADTEGLRSFLEKAVNNAPFGALVTQVDSDVVLDPRIVVLPLSTLMLLR
jgi:predicted AAA+ superfamily ATPase